MRKLLTIFAFLLFATSAHAQGVWTPQYTLGNGTVTIGLSAISNAINNSGTQVLVQNFNDTNYEIHNIGVMASGIANSGNANIWGVGVYGHGYTNGATRSSGVIGEGLVTASADTGSAIGMRGYATSTHSGGLNVGLYGTASGSSTGNYAFYSPASGGDFAMNAVTLISGTAPTISSGFGTSPSVTAGTTTAAFRVNVGTGGTATTGVIGLPAATTGWNCFAQDITTPTNHVTTETASTTTTASFSVPTAWTASDILAISCFAY
jgi:hypothetical protein